MGDRTTAVASPSNGIRLTVTQWVVVAAVSAGAAVVTPYLWMHAVEIDTREDRRIPFESSEDYWLFSRYADAALRESEVLVLGDSVVWGVYVGSERTLTHFLNRRSGGHRFANLGIDGAHPAALSGLIEHHLRRIERRTVLLHLNPLWLSSPRQDLSDPKLYRFNHPGLVPQFFPRIPCYGADADTRIGIAIGRALPFFGWTRHLQHAYLDHASLPLWTVDHPYEMPFAGATAAAVDSDRPPISGSGSWTERDFERQDHQWVDVDASLQWRFFQHAIRTLTGRGNRVAVLVGPLNEHMLTTAGADDYSRIRRDLERRLDDTGVPFFAPPPLASDLYADASHPLAAGYDVLAAQVLACDRVGWNLSGEGPQSDRARPQP